MPKLNTGRDYALGRKSRVLPYLFVPCELGGYKSNTSQNCTDLSCSKHNSHRKSCKATRTLSNRYLFGWQRRPAVNCGKLQLKLVRGRRVVTFGGHQRTQCCLPLPSGRGCREQGYCLLLALQSNAQRGHRGHRRS